MWINFSRPPGISGNEVAKQKKFVKSRSDGWTRVSGALLEAAFETRSAASQRVPSKQYLGSGDACLMKIFFDLASIFMRFCAA